MQLALHIFGDGIGAERRTHRYFARSARIVPCEHFESALDRRTIQAIKHLSWWNTAGAKLFGQSAQDAAEVGPALTRQ
jgi:hypothetical protein